MNKIVYALIIVITFSSCAKSYYIEGTSNISNLDGRKLYLKSVKDKNLFNIDSCDVIHGEFVFRGTIDSAKVVQVFMDNINIQFPIVLEEGNITLKLNDASQNVSGTPLNDKLNKFWKRFIQLRNQYTEIDHEETVFLMNGYDEETTNSKLIKKALKVYDTGDKLFTNFITENFDNILAPWAFLIKVTYDMTPNAYPIWMNEYLYMNAISQLPSWIEFIMAKAPAKFKKNPMVKDFYTNFQNIQKEMNGMNRTNEYTTDSLPNYERKAIKYNELSEDTTIYNNY